VEGPARGGQRLTVQGSQFQAGARVFFGDREAWSVTRASSETLVVETPTLVAGAWDVTVQNPGGDRHTLPNGFRALPLELRFIAAAPHYLPDLAGLTVSDAAAADLDGDGDVDVVVASRTGTSRVLVNTGNGAFEDASAAEPSPLPAWTADTRRVVPLDADGDGDVDLLLCLAGGALSRLLENRGAAGFVDVSAAALPPLAGDCVGAEAADLDGDGAPDLVVAQRDAASGLTAIRALVSRGAPGAPAFVEVAGLDVAQAVAGTPAGTVVADATTVGFTYALDEAASGLLGGRLHYVVDTAGQAVQFVVPVADVADSASAIELAVRGDGSGHELRVVVRDAADEEFMQSVGPVDWTGWQRLRVEEPGTWLSSGPDANGLVDLPIRSVALVVVASTSGPGEGDLGLDDVVITYAARGRVLVEGFERVDARHAWPDAVSALTLADADGDGTPDLVVSSTDGGILRLLLAQPAQVPEDATPLWSLVAAGAGALPRPVDAVGWTLALDADGDGDLDLLAFTAGQDRFYRNDATGHFFDDTLTVLPVDRSDARHAALADLDLDGLPDVVIANSGTVNRIYLGRADGRLRDETPALPLTTGASQRILAFDATGDGVVDLLVLDGAGAAPELLVSVAPVEAP
jgi:hypothetical protein